LKLRWNDDEENIYKKLKCHVWRAVHEGCLNLLKNLLKLSKKIILINLIQKYYKTITQNEHQPQTPSKPSKSNKIPIELLSIKLHDYADRFWGILFLLYLVH
jgi:hypothetical protein